MAGWLVPSISRLSSTYRVFYGIDLGTTYTLVAYIDSADLGQGSLDHLPVKF